MSLTTNQLSWKARLLLAVADVTSTAAVWLVTIVMGSLFLAVTYKIGKFIFSLIV